MTGGRERLATVMTSATTGVMTASLGRLFETRSFLADTTGGRIRHKNFMAVLLVILAVKAFHAEASMTGPLIFFSGPTAEHVLQFVTLQIPHISFLLPFALACGDCRSLLTELHC
jgi:hypothetical protein